MILLTLLFACGSTGTWELQTWGEEFIEDGIPAEAFEDGCSVTFNRFEVGFTEAELLDAEGEAVAGIDAPLTFDLVEPGPQLLGSFEVPAEHYDTVWMRTSGLQLTGELSCGGESVAYDWVFEAAAAYACEPENLTIASGGAAGTQLTIHGDHLFYDSLDNPDSVLRAQALVDADGDGDGAVSMAELDAVAIATLGYDVGSFGQVTNLWDFLEAQTATLGHIDGEGHCAVR